MTAGERKRYIKLENTLAECNVCPAYDRSVQMIYAMRTHTECVLWMTHNSPQIRRDIFEKQKKAVSCKNVRYQ